MGQQPLWMQSIDEITMGWKPGSSKPKKKKKMASAMRSLNFERDWMNQKHRGLFGWVVVCRHASQNQRSMQSLAY